METTTAEQAENAAPTESEEQVTSTEQNASEQPEQEIDLSQLPDDADAINDFLYKGKDLDFATKPAEATEQEVENTPEQTEVKETPAPEQEEQTEPTVDLDSPLPNRISTRQFVSEDQKAIRLMRVLNEGKSPDDAGYVTLRDALKQIDDMQPKSKGETPVAKVPSQVEAVKSTVEQLKAELAGLKTQKAEAINNGEDVTEIEDKIDEVKESVYEAKAKLTLAEHDYSQQQASEAAAAHKSVVSQRNEVKNAVTDQFPSVADASTPLGAEVKALIAEISDANHPDYALLQSSKAPRLVVNEAIARIAEREGKSIAEITSRFAKQQASPAAKQTTKPATPAVPVPKKVLPAAGSQSTTLPKGAPSMEDILAEVGDDSDKAMAALHKQLHYLK